MPFSVDALPSEAQQDWLLDRLADLVAKMGHERLLAGPVVEPSPAYFPEPWVADLGGARETTRRLMVFAGLGELELDLVAFDAREEPGEDGREHGIAGVFLGIEGGVCRFGVAVEYLADPESLAGVMAHEVAHAFRHHHGLVEGPPSLEEKLTDLTTVYLGFGLLTTNNTYRRWAYDDGWRYATARQSVGYLLAEEMAFVLAAQIVARTDDEGYARRAAKLLDTEQAYCFRRAYDLLSCDAEGLRDDLGVGPTTRRVEPTTPVLAPLGRGRSRREGAPWGRVRFRFRPPLLHTGAMGGSIAGLLGALALRGYLVHPRAGAGVVLMGLGAGLVVARLRTVETCAQCGAAVPPVADECPSCVGVFVGTISEPVAKLGEGGCEGAPVFRVRENRQWQYFYRGLFWGFVALLMVGDEAPNALALLGVWAAIGALGFALGRASRRFVCSTPDCDTPLEPFMARCPRCLGEIGGEIGHPNERLAAEEKLAERDLLPPWLKRASSCTPGAPRRPACGWPPAPAAATRAACP